MLSFTSAPCCLLLEDGPLVAMALEASVEEAGFQVAGPFMRNATALGWLEGHTPDLALVDVLLRDGPYTPVIRALKERGIPFAVYSGSSRAIRPQSSPRCAGWRSRSRATSC